LKLKSFVDFLKFLTCNFTVLKLVALFNQTDAISCLANAGENPNDGGKSSSEQFSKGTNLPKLHWLVLLVKSCSRLKIQALTFESKAICAKPL